MTNHARLRIQQRCIPPLVNRWLDEFGDEDYDGHGGIRRFFGRRAIRRMERELGTQVVKHNAKYLRAYKVVSSRDDGLITTGWRHRHLRRK
jgi:hypothetical protein